jgi:sec-independent protein translocase protein TatA
MITPSIAMPGGWELIVIVLVIVLLFGARKLPELARGTGQALRIFKSETKGLTDDDSDDKPQQTTGELPRGSESTGSTEDTEAAPETKPSSRDGN